MQSAEQPSQTAAPRAVDSAPARREVVSDLEPREIHEVYRESAESLRRIVRTNLTLDDDILDDACQYAWAQLVAPGAQVRSGFELPWLATTATREALRLVRAQRGAVSLSTACASNDADGRPNGLSEPAASGPGPAQLAELHDRLGSLTRLPRRQQTFVWLHGFGYDYDEIGTATDTSPRTVQRQLQKARRKLAS